MNRLAKTDGTNSRPLPVQPVAATVAVPDGDRPVRRPGQPRVQVRQGRRPAERGEPAGPLHDVALQDSTAAAATPARPGPSSSRRCRRPAGRPRRGAQDPSGVRRGSAVPGEVAVDFSACPVGRRRRVPLPARRRTTHAGAGRRRLDEVGVVVRSAGTGDTRAPTAGSAPAQRRVAAAAIRPTHGRSAPVALVARRAAAGPTSPRSAARSRSGSPQVTRATSIRTRPALDPACFGSERNLSSGRGGPPMVSG